MTKPTLRTVGDDPTVPTPPDDALDFATLWLDPQLGDGITDTSYHSVPAGKPKDFFRTAPDAAYRRRCEIYTHTNRRARSTSSTISSRRRCAV